MNMLRPRLLAHAVIDAAAWRPAAARLLLHDLIPADRRSSRQFDDRERRAAALGWLAGAQDATGDGGFAGRYSVRHGWSSSYPETTGYIIPTLLRDAARPGQACSEERAVRAGRFLLGLQLDSGAFPGGEVDENRSEPSVFNTAQILHGLHHLHLHTHEEAYLTAAERAARWLASVQADDGAWRAHIYMEPSAYYAHASCHLAEFAVHHGADDLRSAAERHLDWVLSLHHAEGPWFERWGFGAEDHAAGRTVTHTMAYTLWGTLRLGKLLDRPDAVRAASRTAERLAEHVVRWGWLPGKIRRGFEPAAAYTCLTGNAQISLVWMDLDDPADPPTVARAVNVVLDRVRAAQYMGNRAELRGALAGSDPLWGGYIYLAYPNWAAKYLVDALDALQRAEEGA